MKPSKEMYKIAVLECQKAYKNNIDLGTTEFTLTTHELNGESTQFLSIPGSNEFWDWIKNFDLRSVKGFKKAAYDAAMDILTSQEFRYSIDYGSQIVINGHSKAGATIVQLADYFKNSDNVYCIAFAPAPSIRRKINYTFNNLTLMRDPDDVVHQAGIISFGQPKVPKERDIWLPNDHIGKYIKDHDLSNFKEFIDGM